MEYLQLYEGTQDADEVRHNLAIFGLILFAVLIAFLAFQPHFSIGTIPLWFKRYFTIEE